MLAAALGLLVGLVIGGLGGGGGVLTVPLLVYALGQNAQDATTGSLIIVGIAALVGTIARIRGGIDWRTAITFGLIGIPAAYLGTLLNRHVSQPVLLLTFAVLTILAAGAMLLDDRRTPTPDEPGESPGDVPRGDDRAAASVSTRRDRGSLAVMIGKVTVCSTAVGFLTGFLGVGGGFLIVPALVIALRMPMALAVGTSLLIIVLNAISSVASRLDQLHLDWTVIIPFTIAAVAGTLIGKKLADALSGTVLTRAFAMLLILVGLFVGIESLIAF